MLTAAACADNGEPLEPTDSAIVVTEGLSSSDQTVRLGSGDVLAITANGEANRYTVGGSVTRLAGSGLRLHLEAGGFYSAELAVEHDGTFTFPIDLDDVSAYDVWVSSPPEHPGQTCAIERGRGELHGADVTDVAVTCTSDPYQVA